MRSVAMSEETFGTELRRMRRSNPAGISLADVADVAECSITYISAIERGERNPPSNEKIRRILKFLGFEDQVDRMIALAINARKAVEIPTDGTSANWTHVLLGLARKSEQGLRDDDPLVTKIRELLESDDEEEKKCLPMFHGSRQSQSGRSKKKRRRS